MGILDLVSQSKKLLRHRMSLKLFLISFLLWAVQSKWLLVETEDDKVYEEPRKVYKSNDEENNWKTKDHGNEYGIDYEDDYQMPPDCDELKLPKGFYSFSGKPAREIVDCTWDWDRCTEKGEWPSNKECCDNRFKQCSMSVMGGVNTTHTPPVLPVHTTSAPETTSTRPPLISDNIRPIDEEGTGVNEKEDGEGEKELAWRPDGRCGANFPAPSGESGQCDPQANANEKGPCCSSAGWCGNSAAHCDCLTCIDYSTADESIYGVNATCYVDDEDRILKHFLRDQDESNTPSKCVAECGSLGYPLAGVQYSHNCFCGHRLAHRARIAPRTDCNTPCSGDESVFCGGTWRMNVYSTRTSNTPGQGCLPGHAKDDKDDKDCCSSTTFPRCCHRVFTKDFWCEKDPSSWGTSWQGMKVSTSECGCGRNHI